MSPAAWPPIAARSRALVHHASLLMGVLTQPRDSGTAPDPRPAAARRAARAAHALMEPLAARPELAAHLRMLQRFDAALAAWQHSVSAGSPLERRYQTALLQQAAQVLTCCLHVEDLALSECARVDPPAFDSRARSDRAAS